MIRHRHNSSGFTLLELVLVMFLLCVIMGMAAPSLRGFVSGSGSRDAVVQIVALTHWARSQAVADGKVYRLNFDLDAGTYQLTMQEQAEFIPLNTEFGRMFALPQQLRLSLSRTRPSPGQASNSTFANRMSGGNNNNNNGSMGDFIEFQPDGRNQPIAITLTDQKGQASVISCPSPTEPFQVEEEGGR